jgi:gamma-glutamyl-gamma-aminobutyrate hydrolase PuuD
MPNKKTRKIKKRNNQTKIKKNKSKKGKKKKYTAKGCSLKTSWQFKKILNKNKYKGLTVGIITAPLTPNKQFFQVCGDSYVASSHITWLERFGVRIIPIPWSTKKFNYYLKICNGFYFPSGGAFAGTQKEFYNCCKTFFNMAIKENDKGRYTPIWGGCMGMQQLMIIAEGNDDLEKLLQRFDSYDNLLSTLEFTKQGLNSRLLKDMAQTQITKLSKHECTLNNHYMGITPYKFKQKEKLNKFFKIISTSDDRKGRTYVSTIEAYHYPFYGVQWHPERSSEMDYFIEFFIKEMRKNPKRSKKKVKKMFTKKIDCMGYSNTLYKKCNFYWHNRTSKHNRQLCNAAQIQKNRKESNETGV